MKMMHIKKIGVFLLAGLWVLPSMAITVNPVQLFTDSGFRGISEPTSMQIFIDLHGEDMMPSYDGGSFWVRVVKKDEHYRIYPDILFEYPMPKAAYIKSFPMHRYTQVRETLNKIRTFGVVTPYTTAVICDKPNTTIRFKRKKVRIAHNCGANAPVADKATLKAEALLKALQTETVNRPDMRTPIRRIQN